MTQTASVTDTLTSVDPATGAVVGEWPVDDAEAVRAAVAAARAAARAWVGLGFDGRKKALLRWKAHLVNHADELCELVRRENGKPLDDAYLELALTVEHIDWAAKNARKALAPRKVRPGPLTANFAGVVEQRPLGVVGVIGPWNYPLYTPNGSIAYALAAGNAVVYKPSEYTTAIGHYFAAAFAKANPELPDGIIAVVTGRGETGAALVRSGVDKIAFTGSTPTGKRIMAAAAESLTPVVLECGGKDAVIVAEDADVAAAADAVAFGAMGNSGQTCVGIERAYVVKDVLDDFLAQLKSRLAGVRAGSDAEASYGPMTMPSQVDVVAAHVKDAMARGGQAVVGGLDSIRAPYIDPVVLLDVPEDAPAVVEETFGPTLTVRAVDSAAEAVELANASKYGLGSAVFSKSHGMELARAMRAGATSVNSFIGFAAQPGMPFGGVGESGVGRIHGAAGLLEFSRPHSIARQRFSIPGLALLTFDRKPSAMALTRKITELRHGRHK
ncbi:MAG: aldehyde dehydrogenase family protein [Mycobacteriaceae bacterium]|nr:aldehyde dehydrogenase family protein [Mycobacteriaceae bacterium]